MKLDLRKSSKKDLRRLFKIADDLDNEEKDNNDDKEIDEDSDKKDLGKDSPEEQKERTMGDNKEEENNNQVQAPDNAELIKSSIEQISNTGREVLKQVEKFKFNLEQTSRMLSQNPQLSQGMMAKRKSVNEISEKLYQIIFDIENTDISLAFQQESPEAVMDSKNDTRSVGEPKPQPNPGPVPPNPNLNNDKKQEEDEDEGHGKQLQELERHQVYLKNEYATFLEYHLRKDQNHASNKPT